MTGFFPKKAHLKNRENDMRERLDYIDKAKGLLIILAVIGHIWQAGCLHNIIYAFHMPAFFVISGILLSYTKSYEKSYAQFVLSRIYSFGIPFIFIELLGCCTDIIRHGITLNIKGYLYNTLTLNYNDPNLWFIADLFLVEIIFVLAKKIIKEDKAMWIFCLILLLISAVVHVENNYISTLIGSFWYYFFFNAGFYGKELLTKKNVLAIVGSAIVVIAVAMIYGKRSSGTLSIENLAFIISGLCGTYLMLQIGKLDILAFLNRILTESGKNTIIIYGTHHIIYATAGVMMGITDYKTTPILEGIILCVVVAIAEIPIIYIINRWLPFLAGKPFKKID